MSELKPAAQRVQAAIDAKGLGGKVRHMPQSTRTAEEAAAACGCSVGQIVKSLVFRGAQSGKPYLLLVSGANRVDEKAVARHLGEALKRPDADYVRGVTGFAIGGIPPLGHDHAARHVHGRERCSPTTPCGPQPAPPTPCSPPRPAQLAEVTAARIISVQ